MNELKKQIDELQSIIFDNKDNLSDDIFKKLLDKLSQLNQPIIRTIWVKKLTLKVPCLLNWGVLNDDERLSLGLTDRDILIDKPQYDQLFSNLENSINKVEFDDLQIGDIIQLTDTQEISLLKDIDEPETTLKYQYYDEVKYTGTISCLITQIENIAYT